MTLTRPLRPARVLTLLSVTWLRQEEGLLSTESAEVAIQSSASKEESSTSLQQKMTRSFFRLTSDLQMRTISTLHSTTHLKQRDSSATDSEPIE